MPLVFQALLGLRELLVCQVMLRNTPSFSFSMCILDSAGAAVALASAPLLCCFLRRWGCF